jgi:hypothetical protein
VALKANEHTRIVSVAIQPSVIGSESVVRTRKESADTPGLTQFEVTQFQTSIFKTQKFK